MKTTVGFEWYGEANEARIRLFGGIIREALGKGVEKAVIGTGWSRRPWIAEITGRDDKFGMARKFIESKLTRKHANGAHTRGVDLWFILESGHLYEVKHSISWTRSERYFCIVTDSGDIQRITKAEVEQWLNGRSE
jgi:hypothetical protein